jgi:hypothetical protein
MPDWVLKRDVDFNAQMLTLITVLAATPVDYGLIAADVTPLTNAQADFSDALIASDAAKAAAETAVAAKTASRDTLEALLRPLVRQIQERPAVTDEARLAAGIPVRDTVRSSNSPIAPVQLVATLPSPATANLVWNSNGNAGGVQYVVEKRVNNAGDWGMVDVVLATRIAVPGLVPGIRVDFRVRARRGAATSDPSNVASVYAQ